LNQRSLDKIIVICGPTGSGKTGFAIDLARRFDGEIVGADSMQIYRYMDIGTAKPTTSEQAEAVHHMIDIVDPDEDFDAATYAEMARDCIRQIIARGRTVFLVGGTGFYIKALLHGLFEKGPSDPTIRDRLRKEAESFGTDGLYRRLGQIDKPAAEKIHPNDRYRILRALEVYEITGTPLSVFQQRHGFREKLFDTLEIGLSWPRPTLYDRINKRVEIMMAQGFLDEVENLLALGYGSHLKSMQSLGYRHLCAVILGERRTDRCRCITET
jgi:tRNA dimethylallyltransferase